MFNSICCLFVLNLDQSEENCRTCRNRISHIFPQEEVRFQSCRSEDTESHCTPQVGRRRKNSEEFEKGSNHSTGAGCCSSQRAQSG